MGLKDTQNIEHLSVILLYYHILRNKWFIYFFKVYAKQTR